MVLCPDRPEVAVLGEMLRRGAIAVRGPADDIVDGIESRGRMLAPPCRARAVRERSEVQQHRNGAAGLLREFERLGDKRVGQP